MHFLITGHTGFKGSWLVLLLRERGHLVSGISLEPDPNSLYTKAGISNFMENDIRCDVRNLTELKHFFNLVNPDVVVHFAAQALVRESYKDPFTTFDTNVNGTINVLNSSQSLSQLKAQLIITSDKVYKNVNKPTGYIESDALGGHDPYSASKAMADLGTQAWLHSFANAPTAIARAGNVIGGGDICADRLIPDLVRSFSKGLTPQLRSPESIRPWQHVLDCLNGYLILVEALLKGEGDGIWNFGPNDSQIRSVADVTSIASKIWNIKDKWTLDSGKHPHEANLLLLNSEKARNSLGWADKLDFEESIRWTMEWYKKVMEDGDPLEVSLSSLRMFEQLCR